MCIFYPNPNPHWVEIPHVLHWLWAKYVPHTHDLSDKALVFLGKLAQCMSGNFLSSCQVPRQMSHQGSLTKCRSNKRRKYKTSNDKTLKDKTPNGTKRLMEKTLNGTKRRMEKKPNGTKGQMVKNVEWKKRWMEKTPNGTKCWMEKRRMGQNVEWKNVEWYKTSNRK